VVLLHGYCEDQQMWDHFIPLLPSAKYITIDLPGFGESEVIPNISIAIMAEVVMAVLKELEIDKTILIGHSMGGYISLAFAEKYPNYLTGLGLFHTHPYADTDLQKASRNKSIDFLERNGVAHYAKQLIPKLFPTGFSRFNKSLVTNLIYRAILPDVGHMGMFERPKKTAKMVREFINYCQKN